MNAILKPFIYLGCVCVYPCACLPSMQRMRGWGGSVGAGLLVCISVVVIKNTWTKSSSDKKGLICCEGCSLSSRELKQELSAGTWGQKLKRGSRKNAVCWLTLRGWHSPLSLQARATCPLPRAASATGGLALPHQSLIKTMPQRHADQASLTEANSSTEVLSPEVTLFVSS